MRKSGERSGGRGWRGLGSRTLLLLVFRVGEQGALFNACEKPVCGKGEQGRDHGTPGGLRGSLRVQGDAAVLLL